MEWNRRKNVLLNGFIGIVLGYAVARWRRREDTLRVALLVGVVFAVLNWLTYEKPEALDIDTTFDAESK